MQAVIRSATRNKFKSKIGDLLFSTSRYSREIRATIPVQENNDAKNKSLLLLTFDVDAEEDFIILKKILPYLFNYREYFLPDLMACRSNRSDSSVVRFNRLSHASSSDDIISFLSRQRL